MPPSSEEQSVQDRFEYQYDINQSPTMRKIERSVCGCDYGATSWTTRAEADRIGRLLELNEHSRLLDIGSGSGWPALYLVGTTGCRATLADIPLSGLLASIERADADLINDHCDVVSADAAALPLENGSFDCVTHSDVLCCLPEKIEVLTECRRVVQPDSLMVFSVIFIAPGISAADHRRALDSGPPFIDAASDYPQMLLKSDWELIDQIGLTEEYLRTTRAQLKQEEIHADSIRQLTGEAELVERLERRRQSAAAISDGLILRELYVAGAR